MSIRSLVLAVGLFAAPAFAQASDPKAAHNAVNWNVFQKLYPPRALAAREEGAVGFRVTLDNKGSVTQCEITHSSGHPLLDQETCNLITLHTEFKPEQGAGVSQTTIHEGMIAWKLPASTASLSVPQAVDPASAPEKVICKKTMRTGSNAAFERTCLTVREWARQSDDAKEMWGDIQGKKGSTSGN